VKAVKVVGVPVVICPRTDDVGMFATGGPAYVNAAVGLAK
jgi:hypothetical protein